MRYLCPECYNKRPVRDRCNTCGGDGKVLWVDYAEEPWSEIVPGLWVGGHVFISPEPDPGRDYLVRTSTAMLDEAGFQTVASLYWQNHSTPSLDVRHLMLGIPDARLDRAQRRSVDFLSYAVAKSVQEGRKTLVRCYAGMNRSGLVAALALIKMGHDPLTVVDLIRSKRSPNNLVNPEFVKIIEAQTVTPREASA
jgi:hypothetical protein